MDPSQLPSKIKRLQRKLSREINAREEAERLLDEKASELFAVSEHSQILAQAMETAADGIALTDANGAFTYMNATHALMFGYKIEELIGRPWSVLYGQDELDRFSSDIMPKFSEKGQWQGDTIGVHKENSNVYQNVTLTALPDGGLICATRDITSKRRRDIIVREMEARLQEAEREATVVTLGRTIAHDLNNLLAAISGYAAILESDMDQGSEAQERIKRISRAAQQAIDVVQSLEDRTSGTPLSVGSVNLTKLVNTTIQIANGIKPKNIRFSLQADETLSITTNRILLSRCLLNILKNAIEAMSGRGEIKVTISSVIELSVNERAGYKLGYPIDQCQGAIKIKDSGEGMSPVILQRIFDPFFSTKKKDVGRGLGLQSLKTLSEDGLAYIEIESELGNGTCFTLYLLEPPEDLPLNIDGGELQAADRSHDVLLVEDDEMVGDMLRTTLSRMGHNVVWEVEPMAALETAFSSKPDIVITDFNMPGMSGVELTSELKRRAPDIPVVIYSGQASEIFPDPKFAAILRKPILANELHRAINSAVKD